MVFSLMLGSFDADHVKVLLPRRGSEGVPKLCVVLKLFDVSNFVDLEDGD